MFFKTELALGGILPLPLFSDVSILFCNNIIFLLYFSYDPFLDEWLPWLPLDLLAQAFDSYILPTISILHLS